MRHIVERLRDLLPGVPETRLLSVIDVVKSGLGRLGGRPRKEAMTHVESETAKPVISEVSKPVSKPQSDPLFLGSDSGSSLALIPDLSKQSGELEGEGDEREPAGFLEFWALYPRKVGKGDARRCWRRKRPPITKVRIALEWQRRSLSWQQGYVPNPSTYINQGRWEDEPPQDLKSAGYSDREIASANGISKALEEWGK